MGDFRRGIEMVVWCCLVHCTLYCIEVGARKRIFRRFFTARCATKSITRPRPSNEEQ